MNLCQAGSVDCEVKAFKEMVNLYRPSREEDQIIRYIEDVYLRAWHEVWKRDAKVQIDKDRMGNILIQIPATGKFKFAKKPSIALQAHMDMVLAKKGAQPGEDIKKYFKDGIQLEEKDGWLQSVGNDKSIGADNTIGVALALRYLLDKNLDHPALELIFTVQEEIGLVGAYGMEIPIRSRRMINLDGMTAETITVGAQGGSMDVIQGNFARTHLEKGMRVFKFTVSDLQGGHSGAMIHRPRVNSVKLAASVFSGIAAKDGTATILEFVAGDLAVLNKIPNLVSLTFATADAEFNPNALAGKINLEIAKFSDEDPSVYKVVAMELPADGDIHALTSSVSRELASRLIEAPHGVIEEDDRFPNKVKTSMNLAAFSFSAAGGVAPSVGFGFMGRSFDNISLGNVTNQAIQVLSTAWADLMSPVRTNRILMDAWMAKEKSWLVTVAMKDAYFSKTNYFAAGIEASAFAKKYPKMDIICIGPDIVAMHTADEKIRIQSISDTSLALQRLLVRIGNGGK